MSNVKSNKKAVVLNEKSAEIAEIMKLVNVRDESFAKIPESIELGIEMTERFVDGHEDKEDYRIFTLHSDVRSYSGTARAFAGIYTLVGGSASAITTTGHARESEKVTNMREYIIRHGAPASIKCARSLYVTNYYKVPQDSSEAGIMYPAECYSGYDEFTKNLSAISSLKTEDEDKFIMERGILRKKLWNTPLKKGITKSSALRKGLFVVTME